MPDSRGRFYGPYMGNGFDVSLNFSQQCAGTNSKDNAGQGRDNDTNTESLNVNLHVLFPSFKSFSIIRIIYL